MFRQVHCVNISEQTQILQLRLDRVLFWCHTQVRLLTRHWSNCSRCSPRLTISQKQITERTGSECGVQVRPGSHLRLGVSENLHWILRLTKLMSILLSLIKVFWSVWWRQRKGEALDITLINPLLHSGSCTSLFTKHDHSCPIVTPTRTSGTTHRYLMSLWPLEEPTPPSQAARSIETCAPCSSESHSSDTPDLQVLLWILTK